MGAAPQVPCSQPAQGYIFRRNKRSRQRVFVAIMARIIPQLNRQGRMNCERLERLAALLEGHRDREAPRFDLQSWGASKSRRGGFLCLREDSCNAAACAVGLACSSSVFANDGLSYEADANGAITPIFGDFQGWTAVKAFFDLDQSQAARLFAAHSYELTEGEAAPRAVATRIRQTIAPQVQVF